MKEEIVKEIYTVLESIGINPIDFCAVVMIVWVIWDIRNYMKNKDWKTRPFINKFNFIIRVFSMILIVTISISFYFDHRR